MLDAVRILHANGSGSGLGSWEKGPLLRIGQLHSCCKPVESSRKIRRSLLVAGASIWAGAASAVGGAPAPHHATLAPWEFCRPGGEPVGCLCPGALALLPSNRHLLTILHPCSTAENLTHSMRAGCPGEAGRDPRVYFPLFHPRLRCHKGGWPDTAQAILEAFPVPEVLCCNLCSCVAAQMAETSSSCSQPQVVFSEQVCTNADPKQQGAWYRVVSPAQLAHAELRHQHCAG